MDQLKLWDYFQNDEEMSASFDGALSRYKFLEKRIQAGTSILNIGVGRGGLESILVAKGVTVSCLDPSEETIDRLRKQYNLGERARVGSAQAIPFNSEEFDVVIMSEVLEHLADDVLLAVMDEVKRVVKNDGLFLGTVPADEKLLENRVACPHCSEKFHRWGHLQSFREDRLRAMLNGYFPKVKIARMYFSDTRSLNWKGRIVWVIKNLLMKLGIRGSGETYFFCAHN